MTNRTRVPCATEQFPHPSIKHEGGLGIDRAEKRFITRLPVIVIISWAPQTLIEGGIAALKATEGARVGHHLFAILVHRKRRKSRSWWSASCHVSIVPHINKELRGRVEIRIQIKITWLDPGKADVSFTIQLSVTQGCLSGLAGLVLRMPKERPRKYVALGHSISLETRWRLSRFHFQIHSDLP